MFCSRYPVEHCLDLYFFFPKNVTLHTSVFCGYFICFGIYLSLNLVDSIYVTESVHSLVYWLDYEPSTKPHMEIHDFVFYSVLL